MKAADVKAALTRRHSAREGEWVCVEEAFCGWTSLSGGIDLLAIGAWQTAKAKGLPGCGRIARREVESDLATDTSYPMVAYEVKVTRADFRRDLYGPGTKAKPAPNKVWPYKQRDALAQSHYFMFAVPEGLLKDHEIEQRHPPFEENGLWLPPEVGLVEVTAEGDCVVRVDAPRRKSPPPLPRSMIAELLRHGLDPAPVRRLRTENKHLRREVDRLKSRLDQAGRLGVAA